jgi:hypothetical protein
VFVVSGSFHLGTPGPGSAKAWLHVGDDWHSEWHLDWLEFWRLYFVLKYMSYLMSGPFVPAASMHEEIKM